MPVQVPWPEPGGQEREALLRDDVGQRIRGVGVRDAVVLGDLPRDIRVGAVALRPGVQHFAPQQQRHAHSTHLGKRKSGGK